MKRATDNEDYFYQLKPRCTRGSQITASAQGCWQLSIPEGKAGIYRLAQLDDYGGLQRSKFPHVAPVSLEMKARSSHVDITGTWGFGLWNDPFGMSMPGNTSGFRLPALPNAAWFFHASEHNHLTLRDGLPGNGFLTGVYRSPGSRILELTPWLPVLPFSILPIISRALRRRAGAVFMHDALAVEVDPCQWHLYGLDVQQDRVVFLIDSKQVYETKIVPRGRLGLVIWLDNQYMAIPPGSRPSWGTIASPDPAWIEIGDIHLQGKFTTWFS